MLIFDLLRSMALRARNGFKSGALRTVFHVVDTWKTTEPTAPGTVVLTLTILAKSEI